MAKKAYLLGLDGLPFLVTNQDDGAKAQQIIELPVYPSRIMHDGFAWDHVGENDRGEWIYQQQASDEG